MRSLSCRQANEHKALCAAYSTLYNERKVKMRIYSVMLEGTEDGVGYFINIEVAAFTPDQASTMAIKSAEERGLTIMGVEEIVETNTISDAAVPEVLSVSGKSYFPAGE